MDRICGVNFYVLFGGKEEKIAKDGFIAKSNEFNEREQLTLWIECVNGIKVYENKVKSTELVQIAGVEDDQGTVYTRTFSLLKDVESEQEGWLYPRVVHNNSNRVKLVVPSDDGYELYEAGICHQNGQLFFRVQLIRKMRGAFVANRPQNKPNTAGDITLPKNVGKVLWYNELSGIVAVRTKTCTARGHWSQIINCETRFVRVTTPYIVFNELVSPGMETRFENEAVRGIALADQIPSAGEIYTLVKRIGSAENMDQAFEVLKKQIGF